MLGPGALPQSELLCGLFGLIPRVLGLGTLDELIFSTTYVEVPYNKAYFKVSNILYYLS